MRHDTKVTKAVVIYHANCTDGFGAAWAFHHLEAYKYSDGVEYVPAAYETAPPMDKIDGNTNVFILDFSYCFDDLVRMRNAGNLLVLLDHHKTAQENLQRFIDAKYPDTNVIFDMNRSGAAMTWDYFKSGLVPQYPRLIHHIQDYDLWAFKDPNTKPFSLVLRSYDQNFTVWDEIYEDCEDPVGYQNFVDQAQGIERYYNQQVEQIIKATEKHFMLNGHQGLLCNANYVFASDVGNTLAKKSGTFGATYFQRSDGLYQISLRSIGDFDVSAIAKEYGGGGHKNAAGFTVSSLLDVYPF